MNDAEIFTCEVFHLKMPVEKQPEWCAKKQRTAKDGDYCGICPTGIKAAKENREPGQGVTPKIKKEIDMAEKQLCSKGCGKGSVKDSLCTKHYREEHGEAPFPSGQKQGRKKVKKSAGRQARSSGTRTRSTAGKHDHECEGCKVLQLQLDELNRAEAIMVAAGLCTPGKFEKAREIARELQCIRSE